MKRAAALAGLLGLLPATALAAGEGLGGSPLWHIANFVLFVAALVYFGRKPLRSFLADRRRGIEDDLEAGRRELTAAEQRLAQIQQRLGDLDRELEGVRTAVRTQAQADHDRILHEARAAAERVSREAAAAVEQELRSARAALRAEAGELAVSLAGGLLRERIEEQDRERLLDEFVRRIERVAARDASEGRR